MFGRRIGAPATHAVRRTTAAWAPNWENLSDADRGSVLDGSVRALTAEDPRFALPPQSRTFCCLLENGWLLANGSNGNQRHAAVRETHDRALAAGFEVKRFCLVPLEDIKRAHSMGHGEGYASSSALVVNQKLVLEVFDHALAADATDVKVVVKADKAEVQFCINDLFYGYAEWEPQMARTWLEASYNMAGGAGGTYSEGKAQKARISKSNVPLPGNIESLRMQYFALARGGRALVSRILKARSLTRKLTMQGLGYDPEHVAALTRVLNVVDGVVVFCGPTGSGKSTSLVVMLEARYEQRERRINIITIEDPAEYDIPCAMQTEIVTNGNEDEQLSAFNELFHAALRGKPHVIMVGEVRGRAAGKLVIGAAQSGHQVFTTIHASSALTVPSRLQEMGIERYLVRDPSNIVGIVFQRLLATLCDGCKQPLDPTRRFPRQFTQFVEAVVPDVTTLRFHNPLGCDACRRKDARVSQLGYGGQTVCAEVVETTGEILDACLAGDRAAATDAWLSRPRAMTAFEHALRKMVRGEIDPMTVFNKIFDQANVDRLARDPDRLRGVLHGQWGRPRAAHPEAAPRPRMSVAPATAPEMEPA